MLRWIRSHSSTNTVRSYATYRAQYESWCAANHRNALDDNPATVAAFLIYLFESKHLAPSTIVNNASAAVADLYRAAGISSPTVSGLVGLTRRAIIRSGHPPRKKAPLRVCMLREMAAKARLTFLDVRNYFLVLLMMAAFLRESEAARLFAADVWEDQLQSGKAVLFVIVRRGKTDQGGHGHTIVVSQARDPSVCPLRWFQLYSRLRNPSSHFLFHKHHSVERIADGTPNHVIHALVAGIGEDPSQFGSHSARRGGATAAAAAHIDLHLIRRHGNWKSDAVFEYIADDWERLTEVSEAVVGGT